MIQRVQTVYLLIITGLMSVMFFLPLARFTSDASISYIFKITGLYDPKGFAHFTWGLESLIALIGFISFIAIFFYKRRKLQVKVCILNIFLMLAFYGVVFYYYSIFKENPGITTMTPGFALSFPLIALILNLLAIRSIRKDEALIRSLDRIR